MRRARAIRRVRSAEEDNVKNTVTVSLKKERLASVCIRDILLSGSCRAVLPMDLYRGRKYCFGVYHTAGLQCLRQCEHLTADQALRAAGALLRMQDICRDHLLFPADYVLSMDTLYAKRDYTEIQLLFIPTDKDRLENPHKRLLTLLQSMKRLTSPCGADYLAALQDLLQMRSYGNEQLLGSLQQWREEIAVSGLC